MSDWKDKLRRRQSADIRLKAKGGGAPLGFGMYLGNTGYGGNGRLESANPTHTIGTAYGPAQLHEGEDLYKNPDGTLRVVPANQSTGGRQLGFQFGVNSIPVVGQQAQRLQPFFQRTPLGFQSGTPGVPLRRHNERWPEPTVPTKLTTPPSSTSQIYNPIMPGALPLPEKMTLRTKDLFAGLKPAEGLESGLRPKATPTISSNVAHYRVPVLTNPETDIPPESVPVEEPETETEQAETSTVLAAPPSQVSEVQQFSVPVKEPETEATTTGQPVRPSIGMDLLRQYALGGSAVDRAIANRELARLAGEQQAREGALRQTLSQLGIGDRQALSAIAQERQMSGAERATLGGDLAIAAQKRAYETAQPLATMEAREKEFAEATRQYDENMAFMKQQYGDQEGQRAAQDALTMEYETWQKKYLNMNRDDYDRSARFSEQQYAMNKLSLVASQLGIDNVKANQIADRIKQGWTLDMVNTLPDTNLTQGQFDSIRSATGLTDLELNREIAIYNWNRAKLSDAGQDLYKLAQNLGPAYDWRNDAEVMAAMQKYWTELGLDGPPTMAWMETQWNTANKSPGAALKEQIITSDWYRALSEDDKTWYKNEVIPWLQQLADLGGVKFSRDKNGDMIVSDLAGEVIFQEGEGATIEWNPNINPDAVETAMNAVSDLILPGVDDNSMMQYLISNNKPPTEESWIEWNLTERKFSPENDNDIDDAYVMMGELDGLDYAYTTDQLTDYLEAHEGKMPTAASWNQWVKTNGDVDAINRFLAGDETALEKLTGIEWSRIRSDIASGKIATVPPKYSKHIPSDPTRDSMIYRIPIPQQIQDRAIEIERKGKKYVSDMDSSLKAWAQDNAGKAITIGGKWETQTDINAPDILGSRGEIVGGEKYLIDPNATIGTGSISAEAFNKILQNNGLEADFMKGRTIVATGVRVYDMNGNPAILFIAKYRVAGKPWGLVTTTPIVIPEEEISGYEPTIV